MKKIIVVLLLSLTNFICKASDKVIIAEVIFENTTGKTFNSGEFYITETNKKFTISTLSSFKITLPATGKYQFSFTSADFIAYTSYPAVINERKKTIRVTLVENKQLIKTTGNLVARTTLNKDLTTEQFEQQIQTGHIYFILHGLDNSIPEEYIAFHNKYGINVRKENCVLDPVSFKMTTENNQIIAKYLTIKYGNEWLLELPTKPFGVK
tara:strand:+ start:291 stop:920 length:630 start_codon:yes stop_codon:yes gene_type:complete